MEPSSYLTLQLLDPNTNRADQIASLQRSASQINAGLIKDWEDAVAQWAMNDPLREVFKLERLPMPAPPKLWDVVNNPAEGFPYLRYGAEIYSPPPRIVPEPKPIVVAFGPRLSPTQFMVGPFDTAPIGYPALHNGISYVKAAIEGPLGNWSFYQQV